MRDSDSPAPPAGGSRRSRLPGPSADPRDRTRARAPGWSPSLRAIYAREMKCVPARPTARPPGVLAAAASAMAAHRRPARRRPVRGRGGAAARSHRDPVPEEPVARPALCRAGLTRARHGAPWASSERRSYRRRWPRWGTAGRGGPGRGRSLAARGALRSGRGSRPDGTSVSILLTSLSRGFVRCHRRGPWARGARGLSMSRLTARAKLRLNGSI